MLRCWKPLVLLQPPGWPPPGPHSMQQEKPRCDKPIMPKASVKGPSTSSNTMSGSATISSQAQAEEKLQMIAAPTCPHYAPTKCPNKQRHTRQQTNMEPEN